MTEIEILQAQFAVALARVEMKDKRIAALEHDLAAEKRAREAERTAAARALAATRKLIRPANQRPPRPPKGVLAVEYDPEFSEGIRAREAA
jgi:hypothetical protein